MKKIFLSLLLIGFVLNTYSQSTLYLSKFEIIGMHESYQESITNIFHGYLLKNNNYNIVFDNNIPENFTITNLQINAKNENCEFFIKSNLNALGDLIIVSISLYNTSTNELVWSDILKAENVEDLDPILYRFSKVIGTQFSASQETDIYDVSEYESNELKRFEANSNLGIFIGAAYTFMDDVDQNSSEGFGLILSYDTREYILEAKGEIYLSDINHYLFSIDLLKPLYIKRNTPFYGMGMAYGGSTIHFQEKSTYNYFSDLETVTHSKGGILLEAHGGYILNRNSNVNLRLTITPYVGLYKVNNQNPYGFKFNIALLFD